MLKNNQKGFTTFEAVIIVVALVAIGAAGYFAYQARQDKTNYSVTIPHKTAPSKTNASQAKQATPSGPSQADINAAIIAASKSFHSRGSVDVSPAQFTVYSIQGTTAIVHIDNNDPNNNFHWADTLHGSGTSWTVATSGDQ